MGRFIRFIVPWSGALHPLGASIVAPSALDLAHPQTSKRNENWYPHFWNKVTQLVVMPKDVKKQFCGT